MTRTAGAGPGAPVLMTLGMLAFTINDTFMKSVGGQLPVPQALFLRGLMTIGLLAVLIWSSGDRWPRLPRTEAGWLVLRTAGEVAAAFLFIAAIFRMPLANATAILQVLPLTVTAAAAIFLGERVGRRRWTAVAIGLVGVLVMLRPGFGGFGAPSVLALAAVVAVTMRDVATRRMDVAMPVNMVALTAALGVTVAAASAMPATGWSPVTGDTAALLAGSALFLVMAYRLSVSVMRAGDVSESAPFRYTGLVWALIAGLVVFGEWPDAVTLIGAAVVVGAGIFTLRRERIVGERTAD